MPVPRWLADEMLGRLARYLRFVGHDTEYVRGSDDASIARRSLADHRRLLTRDRRLAHQVDGSVLIDSPHLADQFRQLHAQFPEVGFHVTFDRCTRCNGPLRPWQPGAGEPWPADAPPREEDPGRTIFSCESCGHRYWEGSHTARIRRQIEEWLSE